MDTATSQFILGMSGAIIVLLLSVLSYFLRQIIRTVSSLRDIVLDLKSMVSLQKADLEHFKTSCDSRFSYISSNLGEINDKLNQHQDSITVLKERVG